MICLDNFAWEAFRKKIDQLYFFDQLFFNRNSIKNEIDYHVHICKIGASFKLQFDILYYPKDMALDKSRALALIVEFCEMETKFLQTLRSYIS